LIKNKSYFIKSFIPLFIFLLPQFIYLFSFLFINSFIFNWSSFLLHIASYCTVNMYFKHS